MTVLARPCAHLLPAHLPACLPACLFGLVWYAAIAAGCASLYLR